MRGFFEAVFGLLLIFVGVPVGVFVLLYIKRKDWSMKLKRLIGGFLVAVMLAFAMSATAQAVYVRCEWDGWNFCWPFAKPPVVVVEPVQK